MIIASNKIGYGGVENGGRGDKFRYKSGTNEKAAITFVITA